jgi:hypothetical protein
MVDRVQRDGLAEGGERAVVPRERGFERDDGAIPPESDPRVMRLIAVGGRCQKMLAAGLDPLHRPSESARRGWHDHVFRVDVTLDTEPAAHLGDDDTHPVLGKTEGTGDAASHGERHLRGGPHDQRAGGVEGGQDAAGLDRHAPHARVGEAPGQDHVRLIEAGARVPRLPGAHGREVVRPLVMHARRGRHQGRGRRHGRRERLVLHENLVERVRQPVGVLGDDDCHGVARMASALTAERGMNVGPAARLGHERGNRRRQFRNVPQRPHGRDALDPSRRITLDPDYAGMGVRAPHQPQMEHARESDVVEEAAAAGDQARVLLALDRGADQHAPTGSGARRGALGARRRCSSSGRGGPCRASPVDTRARARH